MRECGLAAVLLSSPENLYYLLDLNHLGYFAFTLLVVPERGNPVLVTREMERPTVRAQVPWCTHLGYGDGEDATSAAARMLGELVGPGRLVGVEQRGMYFPPAIHDGIRAALPHLEFVDCSELVAGQRAVKSPAELATMRRAAMVSDRAMRAGLAAARTGVPERRVAWACYGAMIEAGGDSPGFPPLIRQADMIDQEHVSWSARRRLRSGHAMFVELAGSVRRYHAPLSRTVYLGRPDDAAREAHAVAVAAQAAAGEALVPGARTGDVYASWEQAARRGVAGGDAGHALRHHCGYLVGIGFPPSWVGGGTVAGLRPGGDVVLREGMVVHLMSWITEPATHVISDTALVTPRGAELLTRTSRELRVVE